MPKFGNPFQFFGTSMKGKYAKIWKLFSVPCNTEKGNECYDEILRQEAVYYITENMNDFATFI
jgi:hypothetical protein